MWIDFRGRMLDEEGRSLGKQRGGAGWSLSLLSSSSVSSAGGNGHSAALLALQGLSLGSSSIISRDIISSPV